MVLLGKSDKEFLIPRFRGVVTGLLSCILNLFKSLHGYSS